MGAYAQMARNLKEIKEEANELSEETAEYIQPAQKPEFEREIKALKNIIKAVPHKEHITKEDLDQKLGVATALKSHINQVIKIGLASGRDQFNRVSPSWHDLRSKCDSLGRRIELLQGSNEEQMTLNLWWMAERGGEDDLPVLLDLKPLVPYTYIPLIEYTVERISKRLFDSYKEMQNFFGLNEKEFLRLIGLPRLEVDLPLPANASRKLKNLNAIRDSMKAQLEEDEIKRWLHTPNPKFRGRTPAQAMLKGEVQRILGLFIRLEEGLTY